MVLALMASIIINLPLLIRCKVPKGLWAQMAAIGTNCCCADQVEDRKFHRRGADGGRHHQLQVGSKQTRVILLECWC